MSSLVSAGRSALLSDLAYLSRLTSRTGCSLTVANRKKGLMFARRALCVHAAERKVLSEQASSSKKPPEVIEKMVTGRLQKVKLSP